MPFLDLLYLLSTLDPYIAAHLRLNYVTLVENVIAWIDRLVLQDRERFQTCKFASADSRKLDKGGAVFYLSFDFRGTSSLQGIKVDRLISPKFLIKKRFINFTTHTV